MKLDKVSAKTLRMSRNRLISSLADGFGGLATRAEFRKRATELIDQYNDETREVCIKATNTRTGEVRTKRLDVRGIVPSAGNVDELLRMGAMLWGHGWDMITEAEVTVKVTKSEPRSPFIHPMQRVDMKKETS